MCLGRVIQRSFYSGKMNVEVMQSSISNNIMVLAFLLGFFHGIVCISPIAPAVGLSLGLGMELECYNLIFLYELGVIPCLNSGNGNLPFVCCFNSLFLELFLLKRIEGSFLSSICVKGWERLVLQDPGCSGNYSTAFRTNLLLSTQGRL